MGLVTYWNDFRDGYEELVNNTDPRIKDYAFVGNPVPPAATIIAYFAFLYFGPRWMKNREAFQLKTLMIIYNFGITLFTVFIFKEFLFKGWLTKYSVFRCEPVDYSNSPDAVAIANATYYFYICKFIELLDTVFFILRKKNNQVTFLHVFHHGALPMMWWWGLKKFTGGSATFHCTVNCFVHIVMYSYYGLAGLGPKVQKYLWWKRYVTVLQLIQFLLVTLHNAQILIWKCPAFPTHTVIILQTMCTAIAILFINFYIQTYKRKPAAAAKAAEKNGIKSNGVPAVSDSTAVNGGINNGSVTRRHVPTKL